MNKLCIAILALLALTSCSENLFGSSSGSDCGKDIKCLRVQAENEFRSAKYNEAYKTYSKIVSIDSNVSIGYYGMAKAALWMKGVNPFDVFRFIKIDDEQIPFLNDSLRVQNRYYQGMKAASEPLSLLKRRDTLTSLYELYLKDPMNDSLSEFRDMFCPNGVCKDTVGGNGKKDFPLIDREYKYNSYSGDLLISATAKTLLGLLDNNNNGCITKDRNELERIDEFGDDYPIDTTDIKKWEAWGCKRNEKGRLTGLFAHDFSASYKKDADGNFQVDYERMFEDMKEELDDFYEHQVENPDYPLPEDIEAINTILDDFNGNMSEVLSIMESIGKKEDDEMGNLDTTDWQKEVKKYKDFATFYKVSTRIDEDGDGCIDEELLNKLDNDGDGIKNENARLASLEPGPLYGRTGINHSMVGDNPEDSVNVNDSINLPRILGNAPPYYICNTPDCSVKTELWGDSTGLVTVIRFTQEPGYWTTNDLDLKLKVAQDTVCPPKYDLKFRQDNIGGCWRYYKDDKFVTYWLKRKLARDKDRIHKSCKDCKTTEECLGK